MRLFFWVGVLDGVMDRRDVLSLSFSLTLSLDLSVCL